jgi:hypothetical protein
MDYAITHAIGYNQQNKLIGRKNNWYSLRVSFSKYFSKFNREIENML